MIHDTQDPFQGDVGYWLERGQQMVAERRRRIQRAKLWKFDTVAVHGLYDAQDAMAGHSGSIMEPMYLSTAQAYHNSAEMEVALSYRMPTWCYSRIANPSLFFLEETAALLETYGSDIEASCLATGSGMSAIRTATDPFLCVDASRPPMNIVASAKVYGGTFQQLSQRRQKEQGIEVRWVRDPTDLAQWAALIDEGTRFVYGEFPSNPSVDLFDIEAVAKLAHAADVPFIVDATCACPAITRPLLFGADIVVHSATKVMCASGTTVSGLLISRKDITSKVGCDEMKADFAIWAKLWPFRDNGPALHPMGAMLTLNDLRTLRLRVRQMSQSAMAVATFLEGHPKVAMVHYPGLESYPAHELARRYMALADSGEPCYGYMLAADIAEERPGQSVHARRFFDALQMIYRATDLGRVKTVATLNAISTHQQQGEEGRALADISPSTVRISVGMEDPDDIISDLSRALDAV